jgi:hypothetical protein
MNKPKKRSYQQMPAQKKKQARPINISSTLLDKMKDGREFESLLNYQYRNLNVVGEIRKSINEVQEIRKNPLICYFSNIVKPKKVPISIDDSDDLPFNEMIRSLPEDIKEIDIALVTPGGFAHQVAKFVNTLRPRFEKVNFILLNKAMSAGTIFALSGDEIVMTKQSQIGPIDPQVRNNNGEFVPAQSLLTLIDDIKEKGEEAIKQGKQPAWTDIQILKGIDPKEIGNAISASKYSIQMVEEYLYNYKFKNWANHSSNGQAVTDAEKKERSKKIAELLCDHSEWKSHGHAITRDAAWNVCKLVTTKSEDVEGLDRVMRRMWALLYWIFENTTFAKIFVSDNYCIIRNDLPNGK